MDAQFCPPFLKGDTGGFESIPSSWRQKSLRRDSASFGLLIWGYRLRAEPGWYAFPGWSPGTRRERVFPLAVRFLKVISSPTSGVYAIIHCTKKGPPETLTLSTLARSQSLAQIFNPGFQFIESC